MLLKHLYTERGRRLKSPKNPNFLQITPTQATTLPIPLNLTPSYLYPL